LDSIRSDDFFKEWLGRIKGLPNYLIEQACGATVPLGMITAAEAGVVKTFLMNRKVQIEKILKDNQKQFHSILSWKLI